MKAKKLIALGLLAFMLAGCGMPKVDYNGVDSPLFVKDESVAAASGNETVTGPAGTAPDDSTEADSSVTDSQSKADGKAESRTDNKKTDSKKTESLTDSIPTESSVASGSTKNDTISKDAPEQLSVERVSIYDYEHDSREDVSYLSSTIQYLVLGEDDGERYEKLAGRLESLSDDTIAACEDTFDELLEEAKDAYADDKNDFEAYELNLTAVPVRTDSSIFSYYEKTTLTGGESDDESGGPYCGQ